MVFRKSHIFVFSTHPDINIYLLVLGIHRGGEPTYPSSQEQVATCPASPHTSLGPQGLGSQGSAATNRNFIMYAIQWVGL